MYCETGDQIAMKFDVLGRISNMRLPDGKTAVLYSVYEAVSNSIHAINDRFTEKLAAEKGIVNVEIDVDGSGDISSISVTDNGVGFNAANLESFETSDSRFKYARGGKGVGRFIWIKLFETIRVKSVYEDDGTEQLVTFRFAPEEIESIQEKNVTEASGSSSGTTITLSDLRADQKGRVRPSSYLKDLALHFFPQFISGTLPSISITYKGDVSSLNDYIREQVEPLLREFPSVR